MRPQALILFSWSVLGCWAFAQPRAQGLQERIAFDVSTVEESAAGRKVLSQAVVEGPPDTDFDILLSGGRFRMTARFLTDLQQDGSLLVRTRLETRRRYGLSERGLPLYEEDSQRHSLQLGFEEQLVLLPFGRGGGDRLLIEITPSRVRRAPRPLTIDILQTDPSGVVSLHARSVPHDYRLEAQLLRDGRLTAQGEGPLLIEEPEEVRLLPARPSSAPPLRLTLTIDRYSSGGPGRVDFHFDVMQGDAPLALNWAGVAALGSTPQYPITLNGEQHILQLKIEEDPRTLPQSR